MKASFIRQRSLRGNRQRRMKTLLPTFLLVTFLMADVSVAIIHRKTTNLEFFVPPSSVTTDAQCATHFLTNKPAITKGDWKTNQGLLQVLIRIKYRIIDLKIASFRFAVVRVNLASKWIASLF